MASKIMDIKRLVLVVASITIVSSQTSKPNIVLILTDDQDLELGSLEPMTKTKALIGDAGAILDNAFVTTPICCPSRSSILTGLYISSHGTINNTRAGDCSSTRWQKNYETKSFGKRLHDAGYKTFYAGKYLNQYGRPANGGTAHIPPGWDWWAGLVGNSRYYNYTLSLNGTSRKYGDAPEDYLTDVIHEQGMDFLRSLDGTQPFLMVLATPTAHDPFTPAPRHEGKFAGLKSPRTPHFNIPVNNTKHWLLRIPPDVLPDYVIDNLDSHYRGRWEGLLSVDEMVEDVISYLNTSGTLDNTYVIFVSDHGYHFGQFGQPWDKRLPYEFDIRVPLLVRGPGITAGSVVRDVALNIDLAPTLLDMAGINIENETDGVSFLPKLKKPTEEPEERIFYIEYFGQGDKTTDDCWGSSDLDECHTSKGCKCEDARNNTYVCTRMLTKAVNTLYCQFKDDESFLEIYNITEDPYQLNNIAITGRQDEYVYHKELVECHDSRVESKTPVVQCLRM